MSEHTKGPWTVHPIKSWVTDPTGEAVCGMLWPTYSRTEEETLANARLIAAAPEMLEALKNIENDDERIPSSAWNLVRSAIAKATGKEQE